MPIPSTRPLCQAHPISLKRMLVGGVCGLLAVVSLPLAPTHAGAMPSPLHGVVSLSRVLRANGLLHHVNGSFDASGYRMLLGRGGAPRFVRAGTSGNRGESAHAASAADAGWSDRFGNVGVPNAGDIQAVAVAGPDVYIGGSFSSLSADANIPVNNVAMWNGHGWYSLGTGTNGEVDALAVSGNNVFAGGNFTNAGGVPANAIARWNGARWFGLAKGMTNTSYGVPDVRALAVKGSTLYAAGSFDNAGGVAAHSIAAWNGQTWKPLGSGMLSCDYFDKPNHCGSTANNGSVAALAVVGSKLYVGGQFNYVGSAERWGLAAWTGSAWAGVAGGGVEANTSAGSVDAIVSQGGALYVAGYFDHVGGSFASDGSLHGAIPASSVARLTLPGSTWHALGSGANNCQGCGDVNVGALTSWAGRLFMSGGFYGAGGDSTRNIAQWTGTAWKPVAGGLDSPANVLATIPQMGVVAAGYFTSSNGGAVILNHIGFWNGFRWTGYGQGLSLNTNAGFVNTVAAAGHTVYAGGLFSAAGWNPINNLARFDGTQWHSMGGGVSGGSGQPLAIATYGSLVFVGGDFTQAGPVAASNIAMWDGRHWHALQSGVDGIVRALLVYNGKLYVGGDFTHAGTNPASHLASWNLTTHRWSAVGGDPNYDSGDVQALSAITVAPNNHF
ncbi:MAG TPA: hypothetical protein VFB34_11170, partial [Chloroflexota bacterium]|nr:hypothetical protein [Chloroflexota bacterium]